tara:strand:+ start:187 stop:642 length:456 start_codon:yes stop_codon:yes gene_type:complete
MNHDNTKSYLGVCLLIISLLFSIPLNANTIKPFKSDGCSLFPEGSPKQNMLWLECCVKHDYAYWKGGSFWQRIEADRHLKSCVKTTGKHKTALLMQVAVRLGGSPFLPTPFRWGYGWKYPRFYKKLTPTEIQKINTIQSYAPLLLSPTSSP